MLKPFLSYEEQSALEAILRFHHADDPALIAHLAEFCNWIRADEAAKGSFNRGAKPPYLLVLLSTMGIHGKDVLQPSEPAAEL